MSPDPFFLVQWEFFGRRALPDEAFRARNSWQEQRSQVTRKLIASELTNPSDVPHPGRCPVRREMMDTRNQASDRKETPELGSRGMSHDVWHRLPKNQAPRSRGTDTKVLENTDRGAVRWSPSQIRTRVVPTKHTAPNRDGTETAIRRRDEPGGPTPPRRGDCPNFRPLGCCCACGGSRCSGSRRAGTRRTDRWASTDARVRPFADHG
jgi:hypothetical protein